MSPAFYLSANGVIASQRLKYLELSAVVLALAEDRQPFTCKLDSFEPLLTVFKALQCAGGGVALTHQRP